MDKEQANFCTYFRPIRGAHSASEDTAADASRTALDALFGLEGEEPDAAKPDPKAAARRAREELDRLFDLDNDTGTGENGSSAGHDK